MKYIVPLFRQNTGRVNLGAYHGLTALRPRCSIDFVKKMIMMAMISQGNRPEFRGEAFPTKHL
jgi:hypothetical protein